MQEQSLSSNYADTAQPPSGRRGTLVIVGLVMSLVILTILVIAGLLILRGGNPNLSNNQSQESTSSQSSATIQDKPNLEVNEQIKLVSGNTDIISNQEWNVVLKVPYGTIVKSESDNGANELNKLVLIGNSYTLEIRAALFDMNPDYFNQPRDIVFNNTYLSSMPISRVRIYEETRYAYSDNYQEGELCKQSGFPTDYCGAIGIAEKFLRLECIVKSTGGVNECDEVVRNMKVQHIIL